MRDERLFLAIDKEYQRQRDNIELIASENYVSKEVLEATGSILTNKYAEGYPDARYYGGCEYVDEVEKIAREHLIELFHAEHVNVQPHSGSQANMAVYMALLKPGDTIMGMGLKSGGHLTHGYKLNFSGSLYRSVSYDVDPKTEMLDYEAIRELALKEKPQMIVAGASAYARAIDFSKFREISDEVGAYLFVDMAHIAGLCATGAHMSPIPYADVVTSTTHKTLRGPRGGIILCKEKYAKAIDKAVFPGSQGGPLMHVIAAKAQCFYEALSSDYKAYIADVVENAKALGETLVEGGLRLVSGGTDNHLLLVDLRAIDVTGKEAEMLLDRVHITCNKNTIPNDPLKANVTSGIRLGTAAMTTRGFVAEDFKEVGHIIIDVFKHKDDESYLEDIKERVKRLTALHPYEPFGGKI